MPRGRRAEESASLEFIPPDADRAELQRACQHCRGCDLYKNATQAVFGEGPTPAKLMLIGEQPGDKEDREGHPFVGPAGRILDVALEAADIRREEVYVTNAVKHFKFEPRGKRRMHSKPNAAEIHACDGWLKSEIAIVEPEIIICLGSTAAQIFLGRQFRITKQRGLLLDGTPWSRHILATYHPSAIVRMKGLDESAYQKAKQEFAEDLSTASSALSRPTKFRKPSGVRRQRSAVSGQR